MKSLLKYGILPFIALALTLSSGCQVKEDPIDDLEETIPDFRDAFTGEFDFNWTHEVTREGNTTTTQGVHTGLINKVGTDMIDIQYRPEALRRMVVTTSGVLTDAATSQDGFVATGSYSGSDALSMTISSSSGSADVLLTISGVRK